MLIITKARKDKPHINKQKNKQENATTTQIWLLVEWHTKRAWKLV